MHDGNVIFRLTDNSSPHFFQDETKRFLVLFESRYDTNTGKMIDALLSAVKRFEPDVVCSVCFVEEAPALCQRFNILGVPTVVAGLGDSVLGESLGLRTERELVHLIEMCFSGPRGQKSRTSLNREVEGRDNVGCGAE